MCCSVDFSFLMTLFHKCFFWFWKMAQQLRMNATKPGDPDLIPRTHMWNGRSSSCKLPLTSVCEPCHVCTCTLIQEVIKYLENFLLYKISNTKITESSVMNSCDPITKFQQLMTSHQPNFHYHLLPASNQDYFKTNFWCVISAIKFFSMFIWNHTFELGIYLCQEVTAMSRDIFGC